jgi:hypothetical protein
LPEEFIYFLFESPLPIRTRLAMPEPFWLTMLGLPITAIFLAWALPGAHRPGLLDMSPGVCGWERQDSVPSLFQNRTGVLISQYPKMWKMENFLVWRADGRSGGRGGGGIGG